jgi:hypothetical protein
MKKIGLIVVFCALITSAWAIPARKGAVVQVQPDGTEVTYDDFLIFVKQGNEMVLKPNERDCLLEGTELRFEIEWKIPRKLN